MPQPLAWESCSPRACRASESGQRQQPYTSEHRGEDDGEHRLTLPGCEDRRMTTSSARNITCTVDEGVARVWLDRPDKLNGLTLDMIAELAATSRRLAKDKALRGGGLPRAGGAVNAGLDFGAALRSPAQ